MDDTSYERALQQDGFRDDPERTFEVLDRLKRFKFTVVNSSSNVEKLFARNLPQTIIIETQSDTSVFSKFSL